VCWEDIQKYNLLHTDIERVEFLRMIISKYFERDSPVELNLPATLLPYAKDLKNMVATYQEGKEIEKNILAKLRIHCVNDIQDVFGRFKQSSLWQNILGDQERIKEQNEMLQKSGMSE
jgi:hypothetical protein